MNRQELIKATKALLADAIKERNFADIDYYNMKLEQMGAN